MIAILKQQYYYFFRKVFKKRISFSEKDEKIIQSFESLLKKQYKGGIGEEWIFNYLTFQFNKYSTAKTKMSLQINWVYGSKGLQNWKERNIEHHKYFDTQFKEKHNIKRKDLIKEEQILISKEYKKRERNRFKDQNRKLLHCIELELYEEKNSDCIFCKFKTICYER